MNDSLLSGLGLHKTYQLGKRSLEVLRGIDLELKKGDFVSLRGASGAGKSTLLHLLAAWTLPREEK
jgi:ABC-type lipoprotein export system ATPase subunit